MRARRTIVSGSIVTREVNSTGLVGELFVTNKAETNVLLLDGEELCGLKQNRVLATTVLMPAHSSLNMPVSCNRRQPSIFHRPFPFTTIG